MNDFAIQPVVVASCEAFNTFLTDEGWTDLNGVNHPGWASGTDFTIRWRASWIAQTRDVNDLVEAYTDQVEPAWYVVKRMGRVEWVPPEPVPAACSDAVRSWGGAVERQELDRGMALDALFSAASKKPVIAHLVARAGTDKQAGRRLQEVVNAKLAERSSPLRDQAKADEEKYHQTHLAQPVDCDVC